MMIQMIRMIGIECYACLLDCIEYTMAQQFVLTLDFNVYIIMFDVLVRV